MKDLPLALLFVGWADVIEGLSIQGITVSHNKTRLHRKQPDLVLPQPCTAHTQIFVLGNSSLQNVIRLWNGGKIKRVTRSQEWNHGLDTEVGRLGTPGTHRPDTTIPRK